MFNFEELFGSFNDDENEKTNVDNEGKFDISSLVEGVFKAISDDKDIFKMVNNDDDELQEKSDDIHEGLFEHLKKSNDAMNSAASKFGKSIIGEKEEEKDFDFQKAIGGIIGDIAKEEAKKQAKEKFSKGIESISSMIDDAKIKFNDTKTKVKNAYINVIGKGYDLDGKLLALSIYCLKNFGNGTYNNVESLINKMTYWYEMRYPDRIVDYALSDKKMENDRFSKKEFLKTLTDNEKKYISKVAYENNVYVDIFDNSYFELTPSGKIKSANNIKKPVNLGANSINVSNEFIGMNIKKAESKLLKEGIISKDSMVSKAIKNYESRKYLKEELLNCVMYKLIIDRDNNKGAKRAYLFAKEFNCNLDIPMMYAVDFEDKCLEQLVSDYLRNGGKEDLPCYIGYKNRNDYEELPTININEINFEKTKQKAKIKNK